jgi:phosphoribosylformylglycinamidine synthase subunit PurS
MARVVVDVMPKPEILDPQGKAVTGALARLGFAGVSVRQGKRFELDVEGELTEERLAELHRAAETLLANTVIENFTVRVVKAAEPASGADRMEGERDPNAPGKAPDGAPGEARVQDPQEAAADAQPESPDGAPGEARMQDPQEAAGHAQAESPDGAPGEARVHDPQATAADAQAESPDSAPSRAR